MFLYLVVTDFPVCFGQISTSLFTIRKEWMNHFNHHTCTLIEAVVLSNRTNYFLSPKRRYHGDIPCLSGFEQFVVGYSS